MPSVVAKLVEIGQYIVANSGSGEVVQRAAKIPPLPLDEGRARSDQPNQQQQQLLATVTTMKPRVPTFVQDRFAISFWVDPVVPVIDFPVRYKEIAECNFNVVLGGFGATTLPAIDAQLAASEANGLKVIAAGETVISNSSSQALWGYQLFDEPQPKDFGGLVNMTQRLGRTHPGKLRFINLLPNYWSPPTGNYGQYVDDYIAQVKPDILCFDSYPNFEVADEQSGFHPDDPAVKSNVTRYGYRQNLAVFRSSFSSLSSRSSSSSRSSLSLSSFKL